MREDGLAFTCSSPTTLWFCDRSLFASFSISCKADSAVQALTKACRSDDKNVTAGLRYCTLRTTSTQQALFLLDAES